MCKFGEEREVQAVSIKANKGAFSTGTERKQDIYNPPDGWVIVGHRKQTISDWGTSSFNIGTRAANSKFISADGVKEAYDSAIDLAAKYTDEYGLPRNYAANLKDRMNRHISAVHSSQSSHNALVVVAEAQGNGRLSDRTSNINLEVFATIKCIGDPNPEPLKLALIQEVESAAKKVNRSSSPSIDIVARKGSEKSQQWKLEKLSNGNYVIWSSNGTHVMDVPRGNVISFVSRQPGERSQQWRLEKLSNGNYVIWTHDRSQVIDVPRGNTATLASRRSREKSQQWRLEKLSNGNHVIWTHDQSQVMDIP